MLQCDELMKFVCCCLHAEVNNKDIYYQLNIDDDVALFFFFVSLKQIVSHICFCTTWPSLAHSSQRVQTQGSALLH